jgi:flagellar hook-associated protein 2
MDFHTIIKDKEVIQMISNAYSYYLTAYGDKGVSKYDSHKKSELRSIYNSMLKVNKNSPLYKISDMDNVQKYAIDLKESARTLRNVASSLTDEDGSISGFSKRKASSSNQRVVDAKYIGDSLSNDSMDEVEDLSIVVKNMAKPQVNTGNYLNPSGHALTSGSYAFDFSTGGYTYEFSFDVLDEEDNKDIQDKLSRLINRSNIGVVSKVVTDEDGKTALAIASTTTGITDYRGNIFSVINSDKNEYGNPVRAFGLDLMSGKPENAVFTINGMEHTASTNTFSVKHQFEVSINNVSREDEETVVGLKPDIDAVIENVSELINSYNNMVELGKNHNNEEGDENKLVKDINRVAKHFKDSLDSAGFRVLDDGSIKIEESILIQAANEGTLSDSLERLNDFKKALVKKSDDISINPMNYVNKKLIAYPHPVHNFSKPYVSSIYSGMMYNGYV